MNISYRLGGTPYPGESARPSGVWIHCRRHDDGSVSGLRIGVGVWLKSKSPEDAGPGRPEPRIGSHNKVCNVNSIKIRRALQT